MKKPAAVGGLAKIYPQYSKAMEMRRFFQSEHL